MWPKITDCTIKPEGVNYLPYLDGYDDKRASLMNIDISLRFIARALQKIAEAAPRS